MTQSTGYVAMDAKYVTLTDANFREQVLDAELPVLVDFWAPWCGPCRAIAPIIEELADEYQGRVKIAKMNVDHHQQVPMQYGIRSIPTLLFFAGGQVKNQLVGVVAKRELSRQLDKLTAQEA